MNETSIRRLQNMLRFIAEDYNQLGEVAVDGIYGEQTARAVVQVQFLFGFAPTGEPDERTLNAISQLYNLLREQRAPALTISVFPVDGSSLDYGSTGVAQTVLNIMLGALHYKFGNLPGIESIDTFGDDTLNSVALMQRLSGLEVTGQVDKLTWNAVARLFNAFVGGDA